MEDVFCIIEFEIEIFIIMLICVGSKLKVYLVNVWLGVVWSFFCKVKLYVYDLFRGDIVGMLLSNIIIIYILMGDVDFVF